MKRKRETPEPVVFFRGRPEESVLVHCMHANTPAVSPAAHHGDCTAATTICNACAATRWPPARIAGLDAGAETDFLPLRPRPSLLESRESVDKRR